MFQKDDKEGEGDDHQGQAKVYHGFGGVVVLLESLEEHIVHEVESRKAVQENHENEQVVPPELSEIYHVYRPNCNDCVNAWN